jgi:hypothetical protein
VLAHASSPAKKSLSCRSIIEQRYARCLRCAQSGLPPCRAIDRIPWTIRRYYFVHRGRGVFATEFGSISYEPGDWVLMPKVTTFRQLPEAGDDLLLVIESPQPIRLCEHEQVGRQTPIDPTMLEVRIKWACQTFKPEEDIRYGYQGKENRRPVGHLGHGQDPGVPRIRPYREGRSYTPNTTDLGSCKLDR